MAEERTFARGDKVATTRTPSAVTDLLARGYHEVFPTTGRPEPEPWPGLQEARNETGEAEPVVEPKPRRRRPRPDDAIESE